MMYDAHKKSSGTAFLLWIFVGWLGAHRFYLGSTGSGAAMLALWLIGILTSILGVGLLLIAAVGIWWFIDLFLISGMVRDHNVRLAHQYSS
jgi:TM2 domain-containing membrane protein YozV